MDNMESLKTAARREMEKWFGFPSGRAEFTAENKSEGVRASGDTPLASLFTRSEARSKENRG
jgi:hypothetical protein